MNWKLTSEENPAETGLYEVYDENLCDCVGYIKYKKGKGWKIPNTCKLMYVEKWRKIKKVIPLEHPIRKTKRNTYSKKKPFDFYKIKIEE